MNRIRQNRILTIAAVVLLGSVASAWAFSPEDQKVFQEANTAYREGHFEEALKGYEELSQSYPEQSVFYFNLANGHYREGHLGQAILNYERSLKISPRDTDSRHNLDYVYSLLPYRVEDKRNWYLRAGEKVLGNFSEKEIAGLALFSYFLFMLSGLTALLLRKQESQGWLRKTLLVFLIVSVFLMLAKSVETRVMKDAIVTAKNADVRYGPSESDQTAFQLGEGLKVQVLDQRETWSRVILVNGQSGWIRNDQITPVGAS